MSEGCGVRTGESVNPSEILTPDSPRWGTFIEGLESWLSECGCDGDSGEHVHRCAKAVMYKMGGINVEGSLAYFEDHGGYCDCEILLNVHEPLGDLTDEEYEECMRLYEEGLRQYRLRGAK